MSAAPRISSNVIYQLLSQGIVVALAFFASPYIIHQLGVNLYGVLVIVGLTTNYFGLVELGLGQATVKFIGAAHARHDRLEVRRVFWTSITSYLVLGLLGAIGIIAVTPLLVRLLNIPAEFTEVAADVFFISAIGLLVSMQIGVASSVPRALERFDLSSIVGFAIGAGQIITSVGLLYLGFSVRAVVIGSVIIQTVGLFAYWGIIHAILPEVGTPVWHSQTLRELLRFGGFVTVSQVIGPLLVHLEKFIIGSLLTISVVAYYTVSYSLVSSLAIIPYGIATVLFPAFTRLIARGDAERAGQLYLLSTKYVFVSLLPIIVIMSIYSHELMEAWLGADFAVRSSAVLQVLAVALIINALASISFQALQSLGRPDLTAKFHLCELALHVPLSFVLIMRFGLIGGALAWAIRVLLDTLLITRVTLRLMNLRWETLFRTIFLRPLLAALGALPIAVIGKFWLHGSGRIATFLSLAMIGSSYWLVVALFSLDKEDKNYLLPVYAKLKQRLSFVPELDVKSETPGSES